MYDQVTVVVGIDAKTIEYLRVSCETWRLHRSEMWKMPWVLFFDWTQLGQPKIDELLKQLDLPQVSLVGWPTIPEHSYESQREKMLSGHVWVPATCVQTQWSMKIDADVIALAKSDWLQEAWFDELCRPEDGECDADCEPRYIAPSWHYTKGVNFLGRLEAWGDSVNWGPHGKHPRLDIPFDPTHLRVPHKRMCSWVSYYNVSWLQWLCRELERTVGNGRLPIPSQDSCVWYAAERERSGEPGNRSPGLYRNVNMKKLKWTNCSKLSGLRETAAMVLGTNQQASMVDG